MKPRQLGAGHPDDVVAAIQCVRRWAVAIADAAFWCSESAHLQHTVEFAETTTATECVVVGTDITNAFGSTNRPGAIGAVSRCCPQLLGLLATSWIRGARFWARAGIHEWQQRTSYRGEAQGRLSTQVLVRTHARSHGKHRNMACGWGRPPRHNLRSVPGLPSATPLARRMS